MTTHAEVSQEARRFAMTMLTAAVAAMRPTYGDRAEPLPDEVLVDVVAVLDGFNAAIVDARTSTLTSEEGMDVVAATFKELAFLAASSLLAQERAGGRPAEDLLQGALRAARPSEGA